MPRTKEKVRQYNETQRAKLLADPEKYRAYKEYQKEYRKARYRNNPNEIKEYQKKYYRTQILRKRGLPIDWYDRTLAMQNGVCCICQRPSLIRLAVDHCHITNKVRGLLCVKCNTAIGSLDTVELLKRAILYMETHND